MSALQLLESGVSETGAMRVLHLHPGPDTGGKSMAAKAALEAHGDEARVFVHSHHSFGYPEAEIWDPREVAAAYEWADIVVLHNQPADLYARIPHGDKPLMVHHHGSHLRRLGQRVWDEGRNLGAVQVVSTLDLLDGFQDGHWLPQIVDLSLMARIRAENYINDGTVRIAQAPTSTGKGARFVKVAARRTPKVFTHVEIRGTQWLRCLERKATADIVVDQVGSGAVGYGANAVEAWGMGLPVISSAPWSVLERMRVAWGQVPFYPVQPVVDSVRDTLREWTVRPGLWAEWGERGLEHARRFHDVEPFVAAFRRYAELAMTVTEVAA